MSAKDTITSGVMKGLLEMLPTEYEPQNPVSQFLCDEIDKILDDSKLRDIIKTQLANKANDDPNSVLERLVTVYNDRVLVSFHNDIGDFVKGLNEADDNPDQEQ
jgi:hypothetical protein